MSKGVSPRGVAYIFVSSHNARFMRGDPPTSQQNHMQVTHREGELMGYKQAEPASNVKSQSLEVSTVGDAGLSLKLGS